MELPLYLFTHFSNPPLNLLSNGSQSEIKLSQDRVTVNRQQQQDLESGHFISQYLLKINKKIKLNVDVDTKSLLVSGDHDCIVEILEKVYEFENNFLKKGKKHEQQQESIKTKRLKSKEQPIDILTLDTQKSLNKTQTTLEYIIVSLCQSLNLQPKQAAALLTNHNHYLLHACIKGVKGNFEPILNWYQLIYTTSKHLSSLALECFSVVDGEAENQTGFMLLNALKCGFYSESMQVTEWACKLFAKIAEDFDENDQLHNFYSWFVQVPNEKNGKIGGGFEASLYALNKHPQIVETICQLVSSGFKSNFDQLIVELKESHTKQSTSHFYQLLCEMLQYIHKYSQDKTVHVLLNESGIVEECLQNCDPDITDDVVLRANSLSLLAQIWSLDYELISENDKIIEIENVTILEKTLKVFKRACRDNNRGLRIGTLGLMFKLLDEFAYSKNSQAPVLYKILTFCLIENIHDDVTRQFMMNNFSEIYINHQSIPVNILVEPLLRIMQIVDQQYTFNVFDFDFFAVIAQHPKLSGLPFGMQLMDQLAKLYINYPLWAQAISIPFMILADRFSNEPTIQDFLIKFVSISLTSLLSMIPKQEKLKTRIKSKHQSSSKSIRESSSIIDKDDDYLKKIKCYNVIEISKKLVNLQISEDFNDQIKEIALSTNLKYKQLNGTTNRGLNHILEFWFSDVQDAMEIYSNDINQQETNVSLIRKQKSTKDKSMILSEQDSEQHHGSFTDRTFDNHTQKDYDNSKIHSTSRKGSQDNERAVAIYVERKPKNTKIEIRALQEIEMIKQRREERILKQQLDEEKRRVKEQKQKKELQEELLKRKYELGIARTQDDNDQQVVLYDASNSKRTQQKTKSRTLKKSNNDNIRLIDLDEEEEERDRDGVQILLQKYQKLFKFLFNKYALSRSQHMKIQSFDYYGDKTINLAEINKMLKDHDVTQDMIIKDQVQTLIRLINNMIVKRQNLTALDFGGFLQFVVQLAFLIYNNLNPFSSLPEMITQLLKHFEKATRKRGQSTLLYEDPDVTTIGDIEMLKELNKRLRDNPEMLIPEGYYKVTEREQIFQYMLPESLNIPESQRICIEVLDEIFHDQLGFNFLEALVTYEQKVKVKPRIKQRGQIPAPNSSVQYMKPIERKQFQPLPSTKPISASQKQSAQEKYQRPELGVDLKVALYQQMQSCTLPQDRNHLQETAEVVEELLQAVVLGLNHLPKRQKIVYTKEVWNKAKEEKKLKELEERAAEKQREERRLKRQQQVQQELVRQKEERKKLMEEQKRQQELKEKENREKELKMKEEMKKRYEQRKREAEEAKKQKEQELQQKQREEEERKKQERQARQRGQKEFLIKQKEKLEQEFQQRKIEKEEAEKAKKELEEWKKEQQIKVKNQMENFIKQNKENLKSDTQERQKIQEFFQSQETQQMFAIYDRSLEQLFKFQASQDKKEIGFNLSHSLNRINFNEFVKFGIQTKITPSIISNDDMVVIFRGMIREKTDELTQEEIDELGYGVNSLSYDDFKKALIRIAIIGQANLEGNKGQKLNAKLLEQLDQNNLQGKPPKIATRSRGRSIVNSAGASKRNLLIKQNSITNVHDQQRTTRQHSLQRKTKDQKLLEDLQKEKEKYEKMLNLKIEDKRLRKPFDVTTITPKTVQTLLNFIQLKPDDSLLKPHDQKMNQHSIIDEKKQVQNKEIMGSDQVNGIQQKNDDQSEFQAQKVKQEEDKDKSIEGVEIHELMGEDKENQLLENIVGPEGQKENWLIEQKKDSIAYELSNDDYSADLINALNESSMSAENLEFERKLSTMTFAPKDPSEIMQKRRRRKNKKRHRRNTLNQDLLNPFSTNQNTTYHSQSMTNKKINLFRSPQITYTLRHQPKSTNQTPQLDRIKREHYPHHYQQKFVLPESKYRKSKHDNEEEKNSEEKQNHKRRKDSIDSENRRRRQKSPSKIHRRDEQHQDEDIEKEFRQYLEFSEQQEGDQIKLPLLQLSPGKIDENKRIFQRHKRFSMHPANEAKEKSGEKDKEKRHETEQSKNPSQWKRPRDKKHQFKQNTRHTKYKFQTYHNQLKKVPDAPRNDNLYLMHNLTLPSVNPWTPSPRTSQSQRDEKSQPDNNSHQQDFFLDSPRHRQTFRDPTLNDIGASMTMLIGSDSFLNTNGDLGLDNFDIMLDEPDNQPQTTDQHKPQENQIENFTEKLEQKSEDNKEKEIIQQQIPDQVHTASNQTFDIAKIIHSRQDQSKKAQIIAEIEQQKKLIQKLLKEIGEKDKIIKEIKAKQNSSLLKQ